MRRPILVAVLCLIGGALMAPAHAQESATGLRTPSRAEQERFLLEAEITDMRRLSRGITGSRRATLTDGTFTHDAHIQDVDVWKSSHTTRRGTEINFRDSYTFNVAAYRLDKLLGLGMVPTSVVRRVDRQSSAVTWWVDDVQMTEGERIEQKLTPPDVAAWNDEMLNARMFTQLVANTDPNLGNFVIDERWRVWMVDFTRAFRRSRTLESPEELTRIDRGVLERLRSLDPKVVESEMQDLLTESELEGLLARRVELLQHFDRRIAQFGEDRVLCDLPPR